MSRELSDADVDRIAEAMAKAVDETPTPEHRRLAIMVVAGTEELMAIVNEWIKREPPPGEEPPGDGR